MFILTNQFDAVPDEQIVLRLLIKTYIEGNYPE